MTRPALEHEIAALEFVLTIATDKLREQEGGRPDYTHVVALGRVVMLLERLRHEYKLLHHVTSERRSD